MDIKNYCESVGIELTGWKAKLYDTIRKAESLRGADKSKVAPMVQELNSIVDELNDRLARLNRECPAEWSSDKAAIEEKMSRMRGRWKEVWGVMGEKEYGLGGA